MGCPSRWVQVPLVLALQPAAPRKSPSIAATSCYCSPCRRSPPHLLWPRRQLARIQPLLVEEHSVHSAAAEEAALHVHKALQEGGRAGPRAGQVGQPPRWEEDRAQGAAGWAAAWLDGREKENTLLVGSI